MFLYNHIRMFLMKERLPIIQVLFLNVLIGCRKHSFIKENEATNDISHTVCAMKAAYIKGLRVLTSKDGLIGKSETPSIYSALAISINFV